MIEIGSTFQACAERRGGAEEILDALSRRFAAEVSRCIMADISDQESERNNGKPKK